MAEVENFEFQTEVKQLLDLMVHSLYSNKEIFLRELISNASDALDKLRFLGITESSLLPEQELQIEIEADETARTLTIHDNGVGMTRNEVIENLGTIARSGTKEFLKNVTEMRKSETAPELIGQFGVGFYASFMVAERVTVVTRRAGEATATRWESGGDGRFQVQSAERETPGTSVTLHLKPVDIEDGIEDYTKEWTIRQIVKKYSDFVSYPIRLRKQASGEESAADAEAANEPINSMKAIWLRSESEVSAQEYEEFYKHISHDWQPPLVRIRAKLEGVFEAQALLFIPSKAPFDLYHREASHRGVQLYVKRVFIMDECPELMPLYLRFVRGVVDSEDLSLNVSREILQQNRQIHAIRRFLVKKILESLKTMKRDQSDQYLRFWREFGAVLKEGLLAFDEKKESIFELMLCESTQHASELTALDAVIERMPEAQSAIYYMTGTSRSVMESSPHLEAFRAKGIEVLFFSDHVDEVWLAQIPEYRGKKFQSVGKGDIDLASEEERSARASESEQQTATFKNLLDSLQASLCDEVKEVRLSSRLTDSAACLVSEEGDIAPHLAELMRQAGQSVPVTKRILEVNAAHPVLQKLQTLYSKDPMDSTIAEYAQLLYGLAILAEGGTPKNPAALSKRMSELMVKALV